ncbi:MAG: sialidase family protein [Pirellulales bacterium]
MIRNRTVNTAQATSLFLLALVVSLVPCGSRAQETVPPGVSVEKIWDQAQHNAFTDLIRWHDKFYCTFREGERHVFGTDGQVRVIASDDGRKWKSVALIAEKDVDLRDPKLSITPDDRLMILMGGSYYKGKELVRRLPRIAFLKPGEVGLSTSVPVEIDDSVASDNDWLWRVVWHQGIGYGTLYQAYYPPGAKPGYRTTDERPWGFHLVQTTDGVHYDLTATFDLGTAGEATALFLEDGNMVIIARNDKLADLGLSAPPYTTWKWQNLALRLGGPDLIRLPDGTIVLGTRVYEGPNGDTRHTVFGTLTLDGKFTEYVRVPSGSDTSYPGMVLYNNMLWASYYSNHEGRTSIFLAKMPLSLFQHDR